MNPHRNPNIRVLPQITVYAIAVRHHLTTPSTLFGFKLNENGRSLREIYIDAWSFAGHFKLTHKYISSPLPIYQIICKEPTKKEIYLNKHWIKTIHSSNSGHNMWGNVTRHQVNARRPLVQNVIFQSDNLT